MLSVCAAVFLSSATWTYGWIADLYPLGDKFVPTLLGIICACAAVNLIYLLICAFAGDKKDSLKGIIDIMLDSLKKRLADKSLGLEVTDAAKELIIDRGFDPVYGARPLRRYLQSSLETLVARKILSGDLDADSTITVDVENGELVCK